jgi:hypothetical protein
MSHSSPVASPSSNFQLIINNALDSYKKRTKNDLLSHPLAVQLQSSKSPCEILAVLQEQVQGLDRFQRSDERWTRWLGPTVNVLYSLSATLGEGVGLVRPMADRVRDLHSHIYLADIFTSKGDICRHRRPSFSVYQFITPSHGLVNCNAYTSQAAKDVRASQDTLIDVFERIEMFFRRLEIYTEVPATTEMMDIIAQIMVEVFSILGMATKEIKQGRMSKYFPYKYDIGD